VTKVETYSNWGWWDQLDGTALKQDERLRVRWPDGVEEDVFVHLERSSSVTNDMGRPYDCPRVEAYADLRRHGARALVRLVGLEASRL